MSNDDTQPTAEPADPGEAPLNRILDESDQRRKTLARTTAELQTLRQSAERDAADAERRGRETVIKKLLPVLDGMEALLADPHAGELAAGLELTHGRIFEALARLDVTRFDVERGTRFDPLLHESVAEVYCPALPPGHVVRQRASGYRHGDRLLRPALVVNTPDEEPPPADDDSLDGAA